VANGTRTGLGGKNGNLTLGAAMADERSQVGKPDRDRINLDEDYEVRDGAGPMVKNMKALCNYATE
jgi:hypothetical protein